MEQRDGIEGQFLEIILDGNSMECKTHVSYSTTEEGV